MIKQFFLTLTLLGSLAAQAQTSSHVGFVDFDAIEHAMGSEPSVEVNISPTLLTFMSSATEQEDPELAAALRNLERIQVRIFERNEDLSKQIAMDTVSNLLSSGWERTALVRDKSDAVHILMREQDSMVKGIAVVVEDDDLVLLNIVGDIQPAQLGKIAARVGVDLN